MVLSLIYLLLAMLSIQFGASQAKQLFPEMGPIALSAFRIGFATLILAISTRVWKYRPSIESIKGFALYGISLGFMNLTFYLALGKIPLGIAVALEFIGPLGVATIYSKGYRQYTMVLLAAIGVLILTPVSPFSKGLDLGGVLWALAAGIFWGLYIIFGKKTSKDQSPLLATTYGMFFAFLSVIPFALTLAPEKLTIINLWPQAFLIALLGSAIPYSLEMKALKNLSHQSFGVLMSFEPVVATLMGLLFLNEKLNLEQSLGVLLIVAASLGASLQKQNS